MERRQDRRNPGGALEPRIGSKIDRRMKRRRRRRNPGGALEARIGSKIDRCNLRGFSEPKNLDPDKNSKSKTDRAYEPIP
jgi:hypothetical protein